MRFTRTSETEYKIEHRVGPAGMSRRHLGSVDATDERVYADVYLNYDSVAQRFECRFFGSVRSAKSWVRGMIEEAR
jgi:hypothetical protein